MLAPGRKGVLPSVALIASLAALPTGGGEEIVALNPLAQELVSGEEIVGSQVRGKEIMGCRVGEGRVAPRYFGFAYVVELPFFLSDLQLKHPNHTAATRSCLTLTTPKTRLILLPKFRQKTKLLQREIPR